MALNLKNLFGFFALSVIGVVNISQVALAQRSYTVDPNKPKAATCDPAYPDRNICIPKGIGNSLNCPDIPLKNITVLSPDPQGFDGKDDDGIGCEDPKKPLNRSTY